jgi:hypothetical protein
VSYGYGDDTCGGGNLAGAYDHRDLRWRWRADALSAHHVQSFAFSRLAPLMPCHVRSYRCPRPASSSSSSSSSSSPPPSLPPCFPCSPSHASQSTLKSAHVASTFSFPPHSLPCGTTRTEPPRCVCAPTFGLSGQHLTWARDNIIHTPSPPPPALHGGRGIVHIFAIDATAADNRDAAAAAARIRDLPAGSSAVLAWAGDAKGFGVLCDGPPPKALLAVVISGGNDDDYDEDADADSSRITRSFAASCPGTLHERPLSPPPPHLLLTLTPPPLPPKPSHPFAPLSLFSMDTLSSCPLFAPSCVSPASALPAQSSRSPVASAAARALAGNASRRCAAAALLRASSSCLSRSRRQVSGCDV